MGGKAQRKGSNEPQLFCGIILIHTQGISCQSRIMQVNFLCHSLGQFKKLRELPGSGLGTQRLVWRPACIIQIQLPSESQYFGWSFANTLSLGYCENVS